MAVLYSNFLAGIISDSPLLVGATTINSPGFANLPVVAAGDVLWLVLDPTAVAGAPEVVQVTAHTASATVVTVVRGLQSTTARQHLVNTIWRHAATAADLSTLLTTLLTTKGDIAVLQAINNVVRLPAGSNGLPLVANSGATNGIEYAQLAAAGLASDAVTTAKILDANVTTAKLADDSVTPAKLSLKICQVRMSAPQSLTNGVSSELLYDTEDLDTDNWHSTSVNTGRITPNIAGWYRPSLSFRYSEDTDYLWIAAGFNKNGVGVVPSLALDLRVPFGNTSAPGFTVGGGQLVQMNGTTDYLTTAAFQVNTSLGVETIDAAFTVELVHQA